MEEKNSPNKILDDFSKFIEDLNNALDSLKEKASDSNDSLFQGEDGVGFVVEELLEGYSGSYTFGTYTPKKHLNLTAVRCTDSCKVLNIPTHFPKWDTPLTHIGYTQIFDPAHEVWADWHRPSMGSDFIPDNYKLCDESLNVPSHIERIIIPETVTNISRCAFDKAQDVIFEVHPDNPVYTVVNNEIRRKQ